MTDPGLPRISVITACYNSELVLSGCIDSVQSQVDVEVEHLIKDGGSRDGSAELAQARLRSQDRFLVRPDRGIYDALNQGLDAATGDVLGLLHSDDRYPDHRVLADVAAAFAADPDLDLLYGHLQYRLPAGSLLRHWKARPPGRFDLALGWMPAHPAVFIRRRFWQTLGHYDPTYRIAGDYDWLLRAFRAKPRSRCLDRVITHMRTGGASNGSPAKLLRKYREDIRAMRRHAPGWWPLTLAAKNLRKLGQFLAG